MKEPCLCGALDCPRCFPYSYKEAILWDKYCDEVEDRTEKSYEEWLAEYEICKAEHDYDLLRER